MILPLLGGHIGCGAERVLVPVEVVAMIFKLRDISIDANESDSS